MDILVSDKYCPYCRERGHLFLMNFDSGRYVCPICKSSVEPLGNDYQNDVKSIMSNLETNKGCLDLYPISPPHRDNAYLSKLLREARKSILAGLYLPAILILNYYVEALIKEIIFLNEGKIYKEPLDRSINYAADNGYIDENDKKVLLQYKKEVRNPFTHCATDELTQGFFMKMYTPESPIKNINDLDKMMNLSDVKTTIIEMSDAPNITFDVAYDNLVREIAINAYNWVYDLALTFTQKYLSKPYKIDPIQYALKKGRTMDEFEKWGKSVGVIESATDGGLVLLARDDSLLKETVNKHWNEH